MSLRSQKQLLGEMDRMNGRRVAAIATDYRRAVIGPLVGRIQSATGLKDLLRSLGPRLVEAMDTVELEDALADTTVQMGLIGRASALPAGTQGRRDAGT